MSLSALSTIRKPVFNRGLIQSIRHYSPKKLDDKLLPPLVLYRRILRAHRKLPPYQRSLGDDYVKNEFKLHKDTDNPLHIVGFLVSWQDYLHTITNDMWREGTLSTETLNKMSPDQVAQLYELMKETTRIRNGEPEPEPEPEPETKEKVEV